MVCFNRCHWGSLLVLPGGIKGVFLGWDARSLSGMIGFWPQGTKKLLCSRAALSLCYRPHAYYRETFLSPQTLALSPLPHTLVTLVWGGLRIQCGEATGTSPSKVTAHRTEASTSLLRPPASSQRMMNELSKRQRKRQGTGFPKGCRQERPGDERNPKKASWESASWRPQPAWKG